MTDVDDGDIEIVRTLRTEAIESGKFWQDEYHKYKKLAEEMAKVLELYKEIEETILGRRCGKTIVEYPIRETLAKYRAALEGKE